MFHQWIFYRKQLFTVCDCFSSLHILLIRADKKQGRNSIATVHTIQNWFPSPLVGNNVGREQSQIIENRKRFNQTTTDAMHEPSTFSDSISFCDFSDLNNISCWEPDTFPDSIVNISWNSSAFSYPMRTTFLESLANSPPYFLHFRLSLYFRRNKKSNPGEATILSVTYVNSPTFR